MLIYGEPFHVRRSLPCTGMGVDNTLFIPLGVARRIAPRSMRVKPGDISGILVRLRDRRQINYVKELLEYSLDNVRVYKVPQLIRGVSDRVRLLERLLGMALAVFGAASLLLLFSVGWLAAETRRRDIALFRALGATRRDVLVLLIGETLLLGAAAAALGLACGGAGLLLPAAKLLARNHVPLVLPSFTTIIALSALAVAATIAAAAIAMLPSIFRLYRIEPDEAMKEAM
jgi:putative ABC transport system permease protein